MMQRGRNRFWRLSSIRYPYFSLCITVLYGYEEKQTICTIDSFMFKYSMKYGTSNYEKLTYKICRRWFFRWQLSTGYFPCILNAEWNVVIDSFFVDAVRGFTWVFLTNCKKCVWDHIMWKQPIGDSCSQLFWGNKFYPGSLSMLVVMVTQIKILIRDWKQH